MSLTGGSSFLAHRRREAEWMDAPDADPSTLGNSLRFIRRINSLLLYTRSTIAHLEKFSRAWRPGETIRMIDFGTGSADIPLAVVRWGRRRGFDVRVVGVDLHETTCRAAREVTRHEPRVRIVRADALAALPFEPASFDYALCGLFLHHLSDDQAVALLGAMDRVARRGIVAGDLLRDPRAYAWIVLFTLFSNPMVKHDARVSVAQAYSEPEVGDLVERSGVRYLRYARHFGHRFVLAGEK